MGRSVYITDPEVAAAYHVAQGQWAVIDNDDEAEWLVLNRHAYTLHSPHALPEPPYVNPEAPAPFVPFPGGAAPGPGPAPAPAVRRSRTMTRHVEPDEG